METEAPSIEAVAAANGGPTSPEEDRVARLGAESKDETVALHLQEAEKPAQEEEEEDLYYLGEAADNEAEARAFRDTWNRLFSDVYGCFEDTTKIRNKRFTFKKPTFRDHAGMPTTLQISSVKVGRLRGGLQWPLHVFGMVAIRDCADQKRNMIFDRSRDNCQILTQEVPYLELTGPSRAVVLYDPATFEVDLKVKGATESKDECLSFLAATYINYDDGLHSQHLTREYPGRRSTLEFELGAMVYSLEATIALRITSGKWPSGFHAKFTASTTGISCAEVILLDSGDDKVPVVDYVRNIKLSRSVVSVDYPEKLKVCAKALQGDKVVAGRHLFFKSKKASVSYGTLHFDFCTLGVTIHWSLV